MISGKIWPHGQNNTVVNVSEQLIKKVFQFFVKEIYKFSLKQVRN